MPQPIANDTRTNHNPTLLGGGYKQQVEGVAQKFLVATQQVIYWSLITPLKPVEWVSPKTYKKIDTYLKPGPSETSNMLVVAAKVTAFVSCVAALYYSFQQGWLTTDPQSEFVDNLQGSLPSATHTLSEGFAQSSLDHTSFIPDFTRSSFNENDTHWPDFSSVASILNWESLIKGSIGIISLLGFAWVVSTVRSKLHFQEMVKIRPDETNTKELKQQALDYADQLLKEHADVKATPFKKNGKNDFWNPQDPKIEKLYTLYLEKTEAMKIYYFPKSFRDEREEDIKKWSEAQSKDKDSVFMKLVIDYGSSARLKEVYAVWDKPDPKLLKHADELMKISYAISYYTLQDWDQVSKNNTDYCQKFKNDRVKGLLDAKKTYFSQGFLLCSKTYRNFRLHGVYHTSQRGKLDLQLEEGIDHEKQKNRSTGQYVDHAVIEKTFYTQGTPHSKWRSLYNAVRDEAEKKLDTKELDEIPPRFKNNCKKDQSFETASEAYWSVYWDEKKLREAR